MKNREREQITTTVSNALCFTRCGLNIQEGLAAQETGLTQPQLSNYEKGKALPSLLSLTALADLYDISIDYLLGRCENPNAHKTKRENIKYRED